MSTQRYSVTPHPIETRLVKILERPGLALLANTLGGRSIKRTVKTHEQPY